MHQFNLPEEQQAWVEARAGRRHPFDCLRARSTALVVIDMQNYFMKPGYAGEVPMARKIVPRVNALVGSLRALGVTIVWVRNCTTGTREAWSVNNADLLTPENSARRMATMDEGDEGYRLWPELRVAADDVQVVKRRFSAFIAGSSDLETQLRSRGIDTVLIAGTATNICCESTARDAMMLNFKTVMVSDACAAGSDREHANALCAVYGMFADVQTADEVLGSLARPG